MTLLLFDLYRLEASTETFIWSVTMGKLQTKLILVVAFSLFVLFTTVQGGITDRVCHLRLDQ